MALIYRPSCFDGVQLYRWGSTVKRYVKRWPEPVETTERLGVGEGGFDNNVFRVTWLTVLVGLVTGLRCVTTHFLRRMGSKKKKKRYVLV